MKLDKFKYIICDNNKHPKHSFDTTYSYNDVKNEQNLAIKLEEPYLIVDIDDDEQFKILCDIITKLEIKTRILKTSRGGHFWFKSLKPLKNVVHSNTPLTLSIDIKCWGKNTMEVVKLNNEWREWLQYDEIVDTLPFFIQPIPSKKSLLHYKDGDGRDTGLFTMIIPLINAKLSKDEIRLCFDLINQYIFDEPLKTEEIDKMFDNNVIFEKISSIFYNGRKFLHNTFADYLIQEYNIKGYGGNVYFYNDGVYANNKYLLQSKMLEIIPELTRINLQETYENIRLKMISRNDKIDTDYITLNNGLYNIYTNTFISHTSDIFTVNKLNCDYIPNTFDKEVCDVIQSLACNDESTINLLIEMLGYFLIGDCRFQKSFILLGNGRNGKSMFLEMIRNWLGDENCSSLELQDLSDKFRIPEIVGKMINIGDDSGNKLLENTATFKKLVTGDNMTLERKNEQPFKYTNTAKMIFSANALPPTTDKSDGFFRRCIIVPFNAVYKETDANYDESKILKLITDNAKNYLLLLALRGLQSLLENRRFTEPKQSKDVKLYYELSNNNVLMWYTSSNSIEFETVGKAFSEYLLYCTNNNYKPVSVGKFKQEFERIKKSN